jgi:hypothetical protein
VPLMSRTYPPLDGPLVFERPGSMERLERLGPTLAYQAPMTPVCVDYEVMGLPDGLRPEAGLHWYFDLRVPGPQPRIDTVGSGKVTRQPAPGGSRVLAVGPPCDSPPLRLDLRQP